MSSYSTNLCGLGQFGIITKLKIPIRRFEPKAKVFFSGYSSLGQFITAIRRMMSIACPGVVDLAGTIEVRTGRTVLSTGTGNRYIVQYTVESGTFGECDDAAESLDGGVVARNAREVDTRTLALAQLDGALEKSRWNRHIVDPGFHCILPFKNAERSIADILCRFSRTSTESGAIEYYLLPAFRHRFKKPLFKVPEDDVVFIFGCSPRWKRSQWSEYFALMKGFRDCVERGNGKHYLIGCTAFGQSEWMRHYGKSWPAMNRLRRRYDPNHILNGDFISYDRPSPEVPGDGEEEGVPGEDIMD